MENPLDTGAVLTAALYVLVTGGAAAAVGRGAARRTGDPDPVVRALVSVVIACGFLATAGVLLAAMGLLSRGAVVVVCGAVGAAAVLRPGPAHPPPGLGRRARRASWPPIVLAVVGGAIVASGLTTMASFHHESRHYHYEAVRHFVQEATLWGLPFQNPGFFTATHPSATEVVGAMVAFATGGDHLLYVWLFPASALVIGLAAESIGRAAGARDGIGALAALVTLASPLAFGIAAHSLANDLVPVGGVLAAVALVLRARVSERNTLLAVAGVALGLGLATKYTAIAPTVVVVSITAVALRQWTRVLHLVPGGALLAGPWLVRNAVETGNPLFPMALGGSGPDAVLPGGSGPLNPLSGTLGGLVLHRDWSALRVWLDLVWQLWGPIALVVVAGLLAASYRAVRDRSVPHAVLALVAVGGLVSYAATPYTAAGSPPLEFLMGSNLRYALIGVFVAVICLLVSVPVGPAVGVAVVIGGWGLERLVDNPLRPDLDLSAARVAVPVLCGLVAAVLAAARGRVDVRLMHATAVGLVAVTVVAGVAVLRRSAEPTPLEVSVSGLTEESDQVLVVGVDDLRSIIGADFGRRPVVAGDDPVDPWVDSAGTLRTMADASVASVLVVGRDHPGVPAGFEPSASWSPAGTFGTAAVYVRSRPPSRDS